VPLILWAFWIGVYPKPFFDVLNKPVNAIVEQLNPNFFGAAQSSSVAPALPARPPITITLTNPAGGATR
jgi:NADH-quinone oxidoreductase subunit M